MRGLDGPPASILQRLPGVFIGSQRPRNTPIIDLANIPQELDDLPWVETEDEDYYQFCQGYGLVDLVHAIAYHLPTASKQAPFSESAHSKSYWNHERYPEWELGIRQYESDSFPARYYLITRWSESDRDTYSLMIESAVAESATHDGGHDMNFATDLGVVYEINKRDPTIRTIVDSWYQATPQYRFESSERGIFSLLLADYVWDVKKPLRETSITTTDSTGTTAIESYKTASDGGLTLKRCEFYEDRLQKPPGQLE